MRPRTERSSTRLNSETGYFMGHGAGELTWTPEQYVSYRAEAVPTGSSIGRVCEIEGQLTGLVFGRRGTSPRQAHVLSIGLGVLRAWWGRGIGRNLMLALEAGGARARLPSARADRPGARQGRARSTGASATNAKGCGGTDSR